MKMLDFRNIAYILLHVAPFCPSHTEKTRKILQVVFQNIRVQCRSQGIMMPNEGCFSNFFWNVPICSNRTWLEDMDTIVTHVISEDGAGPTCGCRVTLEKCDFAASTMALTLIII